MNKRILIFTISALLLIAGSIIYVTTSDKPKSDSQSTTAQNSTPTTEQTSTTPEQTQTTTTGVYTDYTPEKLAQATGQKVLFFHASWCPQCRSIDKGITADAIPKDTTIFKVDYDTNQDLRKKYGVTLQTTFVVIDDNQNLVKKHVGYDEPTFEAVKKALF